MANIRTKCWYVLELLGLALRQERTRIAPAFDTRPAATFGLHLQRQGFDLLLQLLLVHVPLHLQNPDTVTQQFVLLLVLRDLVRVGLELEELLSLLKRFDLKEQILILLDQGGNLFLLSFRLQLNQLGIPRNEGIFTLLLLINDAGLSLRFVTRHLESLLTQLVDVR
jgi:hypothetical protein